MIRQKRLWPSLSVAITIALALLLRALGAFDYISYYMLDRMAWHGLPAQTHQDVVAIGFTDADLQRVGSFPPNDQVMADVLDLVTQNQPRAVGFRFIRTAPMPPGTDAMLAILKKDLRIIGTDSTDSNVPDPNRGIAWLAAEGRAATNMLMNDTDSYIRAQHLGFAHSNDTELKIAMGLRLAQAATSPSQRPILRPDGSLEMADGTRWLGNDQPMGDRREHDSKIYTMTFPNVQRPAPILLSVYDFLDGKVPASVVNNKVVVFGVNSTSLGGRIKAVQTRFGEHVQTIISPTEFTAYESQNYLDLIAGRLKPLRSPSQLSIFVYSALAIGLSGLMFARVKGQRWPAYLTCLLLPPLISYLALRAYIWLPWVTISAGQLLLILLTHIEQLRRAAVLTQAVQLLEGIVEMLPDPIVVVDQQQRIRLANLAFENLLGIKKNELHLKLLGQWLIDVKTLDGQSSVQARLRGALGDWQLMLENTDVAIDDGAYRTWIVRAAERLRPPASRAEAEVLFDQLMKAQRLPALALLRIEDEPSATPAQILGQLARSFPQAQLIWREQTDYVLMFALVAGEALSTASLEQNLDVALSDPNAQGMPPEYQLSLDQTGTSLSQQLENCAAQLTSKSALAEPL